MEVFAQALDPETGSLRNNLLAQHLFVLCCNYNKQSTALNKRELKNFVQSLRALHPSERLDLTSFLNQFRSMEDPDHPERDFRLKHLLLRGVRKFGYPTDISLANSFYLVDFSNNQQPQSTVLIGNNGIGKTSLFSALEYAFLERIPSAEVKGVLDIEDYLQNKCSDIPWEIILNTNTGLKYISGDRDVHSNVLRGPLGYGASFCYQGDVEAVEHSELLGKYIYDQLGLGFFYQFISILSQERKLEEKIKESFDVITHNLKRKINAYENLKNTYPVDGGDPWAYGHLYYEKIEKALNEIYRLRYELDKGYVLEEDGIFGLEKGVVLKDAYSQLKTYKQEEWEAREQQLKEIADFFHDEFRKLINDLYDKVLKPVISKLTQLYFCEIGDLAITLDDNLEFKIGINLKNGIDNPVSVNKVLNTFRIKVFTMSLKCALVCCAMKIYDKAFPLIIDDIFDSSDFSHRADIDYYFKNMIEKYREVMDERFPIQIIFFTQDELIGEGVEKGLKDGLGVNSISTHRLIEPSYCDYLESKNRKNPYDEEFEKKGFKFRRLTVKIHDTLITGYYEDERSEQ